MGSRAASDRAASEEWDWGWEEGWHWVEVEEEGWPQQAAEDEAPHSDVVRSDVVRSDVVRSDVVRSDVVRSDVVQQKSDLPREAPGEEESESGEDHLLIRRYVGSAGGVIVHNGDCVCNENDMHMPMTIEYESMLSHLLAFLVFVSS